MTSTDATHLPRTLISEEILQRRVTELADAINQDYADCENLLCIGVLKSSVFFMTDLLKQITVPLTMDFFQTASYGANKTPGAVRIRKDIDQSVKGKDVLLVEDIVDTGLTLGYLLDNLATRDPASVAICTLLDKPHSRRRVIELDFVGLPCPDAFVVGYGLDHAGRYRNLPYVGILGQ